MSEPGEYEAQRIIDHMQGRAEVVCKAPEVQPKFKHEHKWPSTRSHFTLKGTVEGDLVKCRCGKYGIVRVDWAGILVTRPITARKALKIMKHRGCINGGRSE
jgi:hypothetical protein